MKLVIRILNFLWILSLTLSKDTPVTCLYSKECVLPCVSTYHTIIHWYKGQKAVHSFYQNKDQLDYQDQEYKGRTSLFPQSTINEGNVSLLLKEIRIQDEGRYKCYAASETSNDEKYVIVSVVAPVKSVSITLINDTVTCSTSEVYPEPNVSWSSDTPLKEPIKNTIKDGNFFMVTSELKTGNIMNNYTYNCSIINEKDNVTLYTATLKQQVLSLQDEVILPCPFTKDKPFILTFSTILLEYNSQNNEQQIHDEWKDKVSYSPEDGIVKLHNLRKEHTGTYTCRITKVQPTTLISTEHTVSGNEGTFKCPVTKDKNYNITLVFDTYVLNYHNQTSTKHSDKWKITLPEDNGAVKLHSLQKEHSGTYTCKSSTAHNRYIIHTIVTLTGAKGHAMLAIVIIPLLLVLILTFVGFCTLKRKLPCYNENMSAGKTTTQKEDSSSHEEEHLKPPKTNEGNGT